MSVSRRTDSPSSIYQSVTLKVKEEFPDFQVVYKENVWWMKFIGLFLKLITFGHMISFMSSYHTTIGYTVYVGSEWAGQSPFSRATTLRHEAVHMRQLRRYGFIRYAAMYLFWVFPFGLAIGRRNLEREAYEETLRAYAEYYGLPVLHENYLRVRIVSQFIGSSYFWMWPFRKSMNRWYDGFVSELEKTYMKDEDGEAR